MTVISEFIVLVDMSGDFRIQDVENDTTEPSGEGGAGDVERVFRDHNEALLRFIAAKLGSRQEAREVAQEAYVKLLSLDNREAVSYLRAFSFKIAANLADPERLGVLGFSYGGTLTSYLVTPTNRFRAPIYGEGTPNLLQNNFKYLNEPVLGLVRDMLGFDHPYEPNSIRSAFDQSAVYRLQHGRTPVLIESGELAGWEVDREFYRGLKHFGVPSEFYVYPRSGHGWEEPLLKQDSFHRRIAWFDYWIKDKPSADITKRAAYDAWKQARQRQ
jgi:dienelactone hydrolase